MILIFELFPHCNLNCDFCFQRCGNKKEEYNNDYHYSKIDYIKQAKESFLSSPIKNENVDLLCLWGGELFFDESEEYYEAFWDFINTIKPRKIFCYSNLMVINKVLRELIFEEKYKFSLEISYDVIGRFKTKEEEGRFFSNLEEIRKAPKFQDKRINITTILQPEVITRQCDLTKLKEFMSDTQINLGFKEYERPYPEEIRNNYNEIILNFYKEFWNCNNMHQLKETIDRKDEGLSTSHLCHCFNSSTRFFTYANNFQYNERASCDTYSNGKDQLGKFLANYNCGVCPFKNRCVDVCPSRMINSGLKQCYRKYLYEHLEEIPSENDTI